LALPRIALLVGTFVALAVAFSVRSTGGADASVQQFLPATVDWHACYVPAGAPSPVVPDALTCTSGTEGSNLQPSAIYTTYDVLSVATGGRLTMPTIYTGGAADGSAWGWNASAPVANVTLQADLFCDGVTDTIAGGPGGVAGDPGPSGLEGANQPWPNPAVWNPYPFAHVSTPLSIDDAYLATVRTTPLTFDALSYDRAKLNVAWLGGAVPLLITAMQSGDPLELDSVLARSAYQPNQRVLQLILGSDPVPPNNGYLCSDTPERMVWQSNGFTTPTTTRGYSRWAVLESAPDLIDGAVSRVLVVQCVTVGVGTCDMSDTDGDLVPAAVESEMATDPLVPDADTDGAPDYDELFQFTDPAVADTDGDGSMDKQDDLAGFNCVAVNGVCTVANLGDTNADDNCPAVANPTQDNTDSQPDFTNSPNTPAGGIYRGDATNPHQDHQGDACDADMDNDGLSNLVEASFLHPNVQPGCIAVGNPAGCTGAGPAAGTLYCLRAVSPPPQGWANVNTSPTNPDFDSDGGLDGRECLFGSDPTSAGTNSCQPACLGRNRFPPLVAPVTDTDGDQLFPDAAEVFYRTSSISQPPPSLGSFLDLEQTSGPCLGAGIPAGAAPPCTGVGTPVAVVYPIPDMKIASADNDADGDLINDGVEVKWSATSPSNFDSDGDGCSDGREMADTNGDHKVNATDLLSVAQHGATGSLAPGKVGVPLPLGSPAPAYLVAGVRRAEVATYDVNKDGAINSTDLLTVAKLSGNCAFGTGAQTAQAIVNWMKTPTP